MIHFRRVFTVVMALAILATPTFTSFAQSPEEGIPIAQQDEALIQDAQEYASAMGVSLDEALRRFRLQENIAELNGQLIENEAETFAGLWIENSPDYRVVVLFTMNGEKTIEPYVANGPLEGLVDIRIAHVSLKTLETAQTRVMALANQIGVEVHTGRNLADNVVELYVRDQAKFDAALKGVAESLPSHVRVVEVNLEVRDVADIYGGLRLDTATGACTSGFSVRKPSTGELGIATSGHCPDPIRYNGTQLTFGGEVWSGAYDVAWYKSSGFTVRNWIWDGSTNRLITYARIRSQQVVGSSVCKYGVASGKSCGQVVDNAFDGVNVRANYLVNGGDSGGPNFIYQEAWGTTISELWINGQEVGTIYSPVDNLSALLGVVILTQ